MDSPKPNSLSEQFTILKFLDNDEKTPYLTPNEIFKAYLSEFSEAEQEKMWSLNLKLQKHYKAIDEIRREIEKKQNLIAQMTREIDDDA